jgi:rare lipoprotein A
MPGKSILVSGNIVVVRALLFLMMSFLCSCQSGNEYLGRGGPQTYRTLSKEDVGNNKYSGHYKVGNAYKIKGKKYRPKEVRRYTKNGVASWYGKRHGFHGKKTANGDIYNKEMLTAAHKTLPLPSLVKVTNRSNGRSVIVLVNDRGPFIDNREIDLSERAAARIGMRNKGTANVRIQYLNRETQKFLQTLGIEKKTGSSSKRPLRNKRCTVNCHIKLVNMKYKLM